MEQRFWIACYDVRDARRLRRVARVMERFGVRVQKSVFECWVTEASLEQMREAVTAEMKEGEDSLRLYTACATCREQCETEGNTLIQTTRGYYIV